MSLKLTKFLNILLRIHMNTNTALRTSISTNVCKGFSIALASAFHIRIGILMFVKALVLY